MHHLWIAAVSCLLLAGAAVAGAQVPQVDVPAARRPVRLDGRLRRGEWDDAAVLRRLFLFGGTQPAPVATEVYLKYEPGALLVGVHCSESESGYPKAHPRRATDSLEDDDAVQVVLGTADECLPREALSPGGYEGATGTPASMADHYYQFTVNAVGASSRTYNEGVLERPLFQSAVSRRRGGWQVEMKIPLSSAGIPRRAVRTVFFNFFRFRPPDMLGWHIPAFGGYVPMPFGTLRFSTDGLRTVETPLPAPPAAATAPKALAVFGEIEWYPLASKVIAVVANPGATGGVAARLVVDGVGETRSNAAYDGAPLIVRVPVSFRAPIRATLTLSGASGDVLFSRARSFEPAPEKPPWLGNQVAAEYAADGVPRPWRRPEVDGTRVRLYDKTIDFGPNGLYRSVSDSDGDLLAGSAEIRLSVRGRAVTLRSGAVTVRLLGARALIEAEQRFRKGRVAVRSVVDYDGFTVVKLRVTGVNPTLIERLSVRIPLRREHARFVYRDLAQTARQLTGFGWEGKAGPVWLGGHEKGLSFDYDTPLFLSTRARSQVQALEEGGRVWLQANLVDAPGQVREPGHIFRFFLQPTPTKRPSLRKLGLYSGIDLWFEEWSDFQGYPDLAKMDQVKARSARAHAQGKLQLLYFGQLLAANAPGFAEFRNDLIAPPERGWYRRAYDPGKGIPCYVSCARGPFGEMLLSGIQRLADEGGIDGVYMDGTSVPWECQNPSHDYCAGRPAIRWDGDDQTPYVGTRRFLKRLRGIFDRRGKPYFLVAHTGGSINIATMSLCDGYYEGEHLARYRPGYRLPLHIFAAGYGGRAWGFRTDLLPVRPVYSCEQMRTWGLLHDGQVGDGPYGETGGAALEARIYGDFQDDATVAYYPYWRKQPHVRVIRGAVLCSYYRKSSAAMLVVGNLTWRDEAVEVDLSRLFPGSGIRVTDVVAQEPVPLNGSRVRLEVKSHRYAVLRVDMVGERPVGAAAATARPAPPQRPAFRVERLVPEDWELGREASGVTVERGYPLGDGLSGVRLASTRYASKCTALLARHAFGPSGSARLRVRHNGILEILVGRAGLLWDGASWSAVAPDPWSRGSLYQPGAVYDRSVELVLSVKDGVLDATYDGRPLARELGLSGLSGVDHQSLLSLSTWNGDWFAFDVRSLSSEPLALFAARMTHPVL